MSTPTGAPNPRTTDIFVDGLPANFKPTENAPVPVVQCTTIKKDGQRCRRFSIRGATVCHRHGGNLPGVQERAAAIIEAARMRLVSSADDAIDTLEDLLKPGTAEAVRLKAATEVLDRVGIKGGFDLNVEVTNHGPDPAAQVRERLARLHTPAEIEPAEEDIQDAEVIEDTLF